MKRGKTEVETLNLNGWGLGDILEGDEGHGPDQIKIIAMANERFICQWRDRSTGEFQRESANTTLAYREWRKIGHDPDYRHIPSIGLRKAKQLGTIRGVLVETTGGKQAAGHDLGRVQWLPNTEPSASRGLNGHDDDVIDYQAVANSAIRDISEVADLLGYGNDFSERPITDLVREFLAKQRIEPGWEVLPVDLRTHLHDFREAIDQVMATGDEDGYWKHQLLTLERVELMLIDRALEDPAFTTAQDGISCGYPELDAGTEVA